MARPPSTAKRRARDPRWKYPLDPPHPAAVATWTPRSEHVSDDTRQPVASYRDTPRLSSDHDEMAARIHTYRFTLSFDVEPGHPAYDDPEWAADAAWGTLSNECGLRAVYSDIEEVDVSVDT